MALSKHLSKFEEKFTKSVIDNKQIESGGIIIREQIDSLQSTIDYLSKEMRYCKDSALQEFYALPNKKIDPNKSFGETQNCNKNKNVISKIYQPITIEHNSHQYEFFDHEASMSIHSTICNFFTEFQEAGFSYIQGCDFINKSTLNSLGPSYSEENKHPIIKPKPGSGNISDDIQLYLTGSASLPNMLAYVVNGIGLKNARRVFTRGKVFTNNKEKSRVDQMERIAFLSISSDQEQCTQDYRRLIRNMIEILKTLKISFKSFDINTEALKPFESQAYRAMSFNPRNYAGEIMIGYICNLNDYYSDRLDCTLPENKKCFINYGYFGNFNNLFFTE
ncbi:MAG: hypothetical protein MHMPM18_003532 [Marteilia pararefringens]